MVRPPHTSASWSRSPKEHWRLRIEQEAEVQGEDEDGLGSAIGKGAAASGRFLILALCCLLVCALLSTAGVPDQEAQVSMGCLCPVWMAASGCISGGGGAVCAELWTHAQKRCSHRLPHMPSDARTRRRHWNQVDTAQAAALVTRDHPGPLQSSRVTGRN